MYLFLRSICLPGDGRRSAPFANLMPMAKCATIVVELNCYETGFGTGEDAPATLWLVPRRVEAWSDLDSLKTEAVYIVGPLALRLVNGVASSLTEALRQLEIQAKELTVTDD